MSKEGRFERMENYLRELEFLNDGDKLEEHVMGDYWDFMTQVRGNYYFTSSSFIFVGGLAGITNFCIPYNRITGIRKCNVGGLIKFMPTGIMVTYTDMNGNEKSLRCSVMKRKNWMDFLSNKSGVAVG